MINLTSIGPLTSSPARNIAIEEGLRSLLVQRLTQLPAGGQNPAGFISTYVNQACVVVGRNQDANSECSTERLTGTQPVFRRTSGGGAVYHDAGNLNWSFIVPGSLPQREALLKLIVDALRALGVPARAGERGEILAGNSKIGGTASAAGAGVLLFHGTILVSANLDVLQKSLAAHRASYSSTGVKSIPSSVANASDFVPGISIDAIQGAILRLASPTDSSRSESLLSSSLIDKLQNIYSSQEWILKRKGTT